MRAARQDLLIAAVCGSLAGAGFGWWGGWVAVLLALVGLLSRLAALGGGSSRQAGRAAALSAAFVVCLYGVGHVGLPLAVEPAFRPGVTVFVLGFALMQAAIAGVSAYAAFRWRMSTVNRLLVLLPGLWVLREWGTSLTTLAAPWLLVGYAQAPGGPLASLFPVGGVFLVGWATLILSGAIVLAVRRDLPRPFVAASVAAILLALAVSGRTTWTRPSGDTAVALVQSGAAPADEPNAAAAARALKLYAGAVTSSNATLIVTPQLAVPKVPQALPPGYLSRLEARLKAKNADLLLGIYFPSGEAHAYYNGVAALGASGSQRYLKQHLFPFGEYTPLPQPLRRWLNTRFDHPHADGARGPQAVEPLVAGGLRLAVSVCYDIAFGDTLRQQAASADAIVNLSTDGSHDSLQIAAQTTQIARARALEFQKPLVRTSDVRGTLFIDREGRVVDELPPLVPGTLTHVVEGRTGLTPYARTGDGLAAGLAGLAVALSVLLTVAGRTSTAAPATTRPAWTAGSPRGARLSGQAGQALPMALALLVIVAGFFYFMVNTGQTVTEKIRVTNAADAAAYSAAVVEARALNYDAYLNRAMLANQMAIAQMVSFASWITYFANAADYFGRYVSDMNYFLLPNPKVAVLDVAFGGSAVVAAYFGGSTVREYTDYLVDYGAGPIISIHDVVTGLLSASQIAVQIPLTAGLRQGQIADKVVKAMDPTLKAEVVLVSHGFDLFTKNYSGKERSRFADVAMRSRGLFTRERDFTIKGTNIPLVRKDAALKKRGGTDLVGLDEWRGVDTLELHGQRFFCGKLHVSWCDDVKTPIGWAAIEVDATGGDRGHGYHGGAYKDNPTTARKADSDVHSPEYGHFSGLPSSREIADTKPATDESTAITILVTKSQSDTVTSGNAAVVKPAGQLAVFGDHPAGGRLASLGRAQVYFDRIAARADGKTELGSLYNPYWRVRLVAPTTADRAYAATKQGGLLMPSIP